MKKKNFKDFVWNSIGSTAYGLTSVLYMIIVTRINGINLAGIFAYAFANAYIFGTISTYFGRTFQVTETNKEFCDTDYFYNKLTTSILSVFISFIFCILTKASYEKFILIIILTVYRALDAIIESIYAVIQRNDELYKVGQSLFIRPLILVIVFSIIDYLTKNMIIASISLIVINILCMIFIDYKNIKGKFIKKEFNFKKNNLLLKAGLSTCLYYFLIVYVINASKYAIEIYTTDDIQAIFGIIVMPASFLSMISLCIIQPFINNITKLVSKNDLKKLKNLVFKLSLGVVGVGVAAIVFCYFLGIPILELIYDIDLSAELINLLIILVGSIFYSLTIIYSSVFIAIRKTNTQLFLLVITSLAALVLSNLLVRTKGIDGAVLSYTLVMFIEYMLHCVVLLLNLRKKRYTIRLMGGLGNQMFEYSILRAMMIEYKAEGVISLKGITNKTHNVYCLNHFNISKDVKIKKGESLKSFVNYLFYGFYYLFLIKKKNGFNKIKKFQPILNNLGYYCVPDGYIELNGSSSNRNEMIGYYQSAKYFDKYKDKIKEELKVVDEVLNKNIDLLNEIKDSNSICIHIRRGDYVGSNHQVCNELYYLEAEKIMLKKVKNPKFYIFSDDQEWVKENIKFKSKVTYVEGNNNYEDLRLMYSCKHFIISNSSFSWWAQYLTDNDKRITIAPSRWFQNSNQKSDIYEDDWILIDID